MDYKIETGLINDDFIHNRITVKAWYKNEYCGTFKYYPRLVSLKGFSDTRYSLLGKYKEWGLNEGLYKPIKELLYQLNFNK